MAPRLRVPPRMKRAKLQRHMADMRPFREFLEVTSIEAAMPLLPKGRLSHLVLEDFLAGKIALAQHETPVIAPLITRTCESLRPRDRQLLLNRGHQLLITESQSFEGADDPDGHGHTRVSLFCDKCLHHFVFDISGGGVCGTSIEYPLHHYVLKSIKSFEDVPSDHATYSEFKLYPLISLVHLECSVCGQTVVIEMSRPRMKREWLLKLNDEDRIRSQIQTEREADLDRFKDFDEEKHAVTALSTFNLYLRDYLYNKFRPISVRNKTFAAQFGTACYEIFEYVGFERFEVDGEEKLALPKPATPSSKTPLRSHRAFIEDIRTEVLNEIGLKGASTRDLLAVAIPGLATLEKALGCENDKGRIGTAPPGPADRHMRVLGTVHDATPEAVKYAYLRQTATDAVHKKRYLEAFKLVVLQITYGDLQMFAAEEESRETIVAGSVAADDNTTDLDLDHSNSWYRHFDLLPNCTEDDQTIIRLYHNYREQTPHQNTLHRKALFKIGKGRNSTALLKVALADMDEQAARTFLEVGPDWDLEFIIQVALVKQSGEDGVDDCAELTIRALEIIARARRHDPGIKQFTDAIMNMKMARDHAQDSDAPVTGAHKTSQSPALAGPVGLANLRNTCYLNSILQYFYSVRAIREGLLSRPLKAATEEDIQALLSRGDKKVDLELGRAFVGCEFLMELQELFSCLQNAQSASITPRQRLANAALLRPDRARARSELSSGSKSAEPSVSIGPQNKAPPLPPRDGASQSQEPPGLKVTVEAVSDNAETASTISSQTLVGQPEEEATYVVVGHGAGEGQDTEMTDIGAEGAGAEEADSAVDTTSPLVEAKATAAATEPSTPNTKLTVEELKVELDKPNVGSDQMDVDEVMGNAIDLLRAGFKVSSLAHADPSPDQIEEAFFSTFVDYRMKAGDPAGDSAWKSTTRKDRWVTAYPAPRHVKHPISLHDALEASFDRDMLGGSDILTYTSIKDVAPHFHIYIQRSDGDGKNTNSIIIPETIYLDRYMSSDGDDVDIYSLRKRSWDMKGALTKLEQRSLVKEALQKDAEGAGTGQQDAKHHEADLYRTDNIDLDSYSLGQDEAVETVYKNYSMRPESERASMDLIENFSSSSEPEVDFRDAVVKKQVARHQELSAQRASLFDGLDRVKYRLHAVICHLGTTARAGHYWVWIHDFERGVWRKYNDTMVTEHSEAEVFQTLEGSEPYYLAYVRDRDLHELVSIPVRAASNLDLPMSPPASPQGSPPVLMTEAETMDYATSEHVEHAT